MAEVNKVESPYLTADEAAEYLRYPNTHAFRVDIPKKGIPCIRRGRRLFFTKTQLDDFMAVVTEATHPRQRRRGTSRKGGKAA